MKDSTVQQIIQARKSSQIKDLSAKEIADTIRQQVRISGARIGWSAAAKDVMEVAVKDLARELTTRYRNLFIDEVALAFKHGALKGEKQMFCSATLMRWLREYMTEVRVKAFDYIQQPQRALEAKNLISEDEWIMKQYDLWRERGSCRAASVVHRVLVKRGKIQWTKQDEMKAAEMEKAKIGERRKGEDLATGRKRKDLIADLVKVIEGKGSSRARVILAERSLYAYFEECRELMRNPI